MKTDLGGDKSEERLLLWERMKPSGPGRVSQGTEQVIISVEGRVAPSLGLATSQGGGRGPGQAQGSWGLLDKALPR